MPEELPASGTWLVISKFPTLFPAAQNASHSRSVSQLSYFKNCISHMSGQKAVFDNGPGQFDMSPVSSAGIPTVKPLPLHEPIGGYGSAHEFGNRQLTVRRSKIGRIVGAAPALIASRLWIGAQRTRAVGSAVSLVRGTHLFGRLALLNPPGHAVIGSNLSSCAVHFLGNRIVGV
jgi:hypothetical protein